MSALSPENQPPHRLTSGQEAHSGSSWEDAYVQSQPPWDIGVPQPAIVRLAASGGFAGTVLDAGCGTGENALHIAALGLAVLGVDGAPTALARARQKAAARNLEAEFLLGDALDLGRLKRRFETVLDCGLFHTFGREQQARYAESLALAAAPGAMAYVFCFRGGVANAGPHPIRQEELREAFDRGRGWEVADIQPEWIQAAREYFPRAGAPAWLATIRRR